MSIAAYLCLFDGENDPLRGRVVIRIPERCRVLFRTQFGRKGQYFLENPTGEASLQPLATTSKGIASEVAALAAVECGRDTYLRMSFPHADISCS